MADDIKLAELRAIVEGIRDRVRAQYPSTAVTVDSASADPIRVPLADLTPILHARDAAQAKMASIGSVNPRRGGLANNAIQATKRAIARGLNWFVRDQVVFNRGAIACVESTVEALNDLNRSLTVLAARMDERLQRNHLAHHQAMEAYDARMERRVAEQADSTARSIADLTRLVERKHVESDAHFFDLLEAQRNELTQMAHARVAEFTRATQNQHSDFERALAESTRTVENKLAHDLQQIKLEFERIIYNEVRVVRQRASAPSVCAPAPTPSSPAFFDYRAFSNRFRGAEEHVKRNQQFYAARFNGEVLDIGCGQGEFLDVMREAGVRARGIDLSAESVAYCRSKGLQAEQADLFAYLSELSDHSLDGIFSSQVVEHLAADRVAEMMRLCAAKLRHGGLLAIETPNPACLAIFATHFYLDPTHVRPVPHALLAFYMEENGLGGIEVIERFAAVDEFPELGELPDGVRKRFFGGLDYVIFGKKL